MMGWDMNWGGGMFFGSFFGLLVLAVLIVLIVMIVRGSGTQPISGSQPQDRDRTRTEDTPLQILQRRYAKGEIDREEYETKRRDLGQPLDPDD